MQSLPAPHVAPFTKQPSVRRALDPAPALPFFGAHGQHKPILLGVRSRHRIQSERAPVGNKSFQERHAHRYRALFAALGRLCLDRHGPIGVAAVGVVQQPDGIHFSPDEFRRPQSRLAQANEDEAVAHVNLMVFLGWLRRLRHHLQHQVKQIIPHGAFFVQAALLRRLDERHRIEAQIAGAMQGTEHGLGKAHDVGLGADAGLLLER